MCGQSTEQVCRPNDLPSCCVRSFLISIPFFITHLRAKRRDEQCSGFGAWVFNAVFNFMLLALFIDFHRRSYAAKKQQKAA